MGSSRKEPCPRCRAEGKDRAGDNLHRYDSGAAFCFSCKYIEKPTKYIPKEVKPSKELPDDLSLNFAKENLDWLLKYLNPSEIGDHFRYSQKLRRHVYRNEGYWEARSVNPEAQPKVLSSGEKPFVLFGEGDPIVVVEDVVSAIKVSRVCTALPLFGSHIPGDWMVRLAKMRPLRVVFWLDGDKAKDCLKYSKKFNLLYPFSKAVSTEKDPKDFGEEDIKRIVGVPDAY